LHIAAEVLVVGLLLAGAAAADEGELLFRAEWGSGGARLSRIDPQESDGEGPFSFAVDAGGRFWVLDQVVGRAVCFEADGRWLGEVALPGETFVELEFGPDGRMVLLDRLVRRSLVVLDGATGVSEEFPLESLGVADGGLVTALFAREEGIWLEENHERSALVLDGELRPVAGPIVLGRPRPGAAGSLVARLAGEERAELLVLDGRGRAQGGHLLGPGPELARLVWLEEDGAGRIWLLTHELAVDGREEIVALTVALDGGWRSVARADHRFTPWHQFREFRIVPGLGLVRMVLSEEGVSFVRWVGP